MRQCGRARFARASPGRRAGTPGGGIAVGPSGLEMAARLSFRRWRGAAQPLEAGLPNPESTRNRPRPGIRLPSNERREPRALFRPPGAMPGRRCGRIPIPTLISPGADSSGSLSFLIAGCSDKGRQCAIVSRQIRCTGASHPSGAPTIAVLAESRNSKQLPTSSSAGSPGSERSPARYVVVDSENDGRRIDNFLHSEIPGVPRDRLYRLLRRGEVRVNGARARASRRVRAGEAVRIPPLVPSVGASAGRGPRPGDRRIDGAVLYEDERLLVLNKPSGIAVHGGSGIAYGVIELLRSSRPDAPYLELVHRLDRETSGCLIVAKRRSALRALHESLRRRTLEKRYVALLAGTWKGARRTVSLPLARGQRSGGERIVRVSEAGRASTTELLSVAAGSGVTFVEVIPRTGRTHQIRVHCAALGHPIAGDEKYGDRIFNQRLRTTGLQRLFLHAASVRITGRGLPEVTVRALLEPSLADLARRLGIPHAALAGLHPAASTR